MTKISIAVRSLLAAALLWAASSLAATAQTSPNFTYGQVPTVAQWNALFAGKQDYLGAPPLLTTGGTMLGKLVTAASTTSRAGLNLPAGTAPTSPIDGDLWTTTSAILVRLNGSTYNLLTPSTPCPTCAVTNATNTFTANQVVNINGGATPTAQSGMILQLVAANAALGRLEIDTFANFAVLTGVRANGTLASPTTLIADDQILSLNAWGYDGTTRAGPYGALRIFSGGTWTATSHPTYVDFATTDSTASAVMTSRMRIEAAGGVTLNGAASPGLPGMIAATNATNGSLIWQVTNTSTGTGALSGFVATNSANSATFGMGGTGYTAQAILANRAFVFGGSGTDGIALYTTGAKSIEFYVNGSRAGGFTTAGLFTLNTALAATSGGTGFASFAVGDLLYADTTTSLAKLADVATGNVLRSGGVGVAPAWGKVTLTTDVTGVLPVANGGTNCSAASGTCLDNITGFASTGMVARTASGTYAFRTLAGTANEITATNGDGVSGAPTFSLPTALTFTGKTVTGGTFSGPTLSGTVAGSVTLSGSLTLSGNDTFSAQAIFTGTSAPASAAGNTVVMGTISPPTLSNNGQGFVYNTATAGLALEGAGSTYDVALVNKSATVAFGILTGTTTAKFIGGISATGLSSGTCSVALALDSGNSVVTTSCPGAASSIQVGGTSVTSATSSNKLLSNGTVSGGTGTLAEIGIGTGLAVSGGNLNVSALNTNANFPMSAGVASSLTSGATDYIGLGSICGSGSEVSCYVTAPQNMTLKNLYVTSPAAPTGVQTYVFTVRSGSYGSTSDSTITCTITGAATTCNDTTHTLAVTAGQVISVKAVASASAATATGIALNMQSVTTSP